MVTNNDFDAEKFAQFQQFHQQFPLFVKQMALQPNNFQKFLPPNPNVINAAAPPKATKTDTKKSSKKIKKPKIKTVKPPNLFVNFASTEFSTTKEEINILVIGETGVGKSTWINGIANYMSFNTFDEALAAKKPVCLIPMNFNLYVGEKYEKVNVNMKPTIGERDQNEAESYTGQSCTQEPKVYRYITDTFIFNLIDTPGIGDTRGIEYDMENMRMVLKCLSKWEKIHGICILLKPNVPRLTLSLRYCLEELLVNLHKSSIPNISVVFTNSCNTLYRPGDTMTVLKKLFDDVKNASDNVIHLSGANTFCIDNEAVRLLYAHSKGAEFEKDHIKNFSKSWKHTVNETYRLFEYTTGLSPHFAVETKSTTLAREIFVQLTKIVAEMNEEIMQTRKGCENQTRQLDALKKKLAEKEKQDSYQAETIEKTPLNYPVTVCCGPNCIETVRVPGSDKQETFHKKICCSTCPLRTVTHSQIGEPNLRQCTAFGSNGFCQACGCSWQTHMQIWYTQRKITSVISTANSEDEIKHINLQIDAKAKYILQNECHLKELQQSYDSVFALCRPYFKFLQQNSIIAINCAMEEYLELSIDELEKVLKPEDDRSELESLQKLLAIHQQQKLVANCKDDDVCDENRETVDLKNYVEIISNLENHEIIGEKLKESNSYKKLFETFEPAVVEMISKIVPAKEEVMEILPGKTSSKSKRKPKSRSQPRIIEFTALTKSFFQSIFTKIMGLLQIFNPLAYLV